jgi:hypothetical protein
MADRDERQRRKVAQKIIPAPLLKVDMSAKSLGPFNPQANISKGIGRLADQNDSVGPAQPFPPATPEYSPTRPDRRKNARRGAISRRFGDNDSGKAWLE